MNYHHRMDESGRIAALDDVFELTVLLHNDMTESLARDGLTTSRAHLLWELHQRGPTSQTVLAEASPRRSVESSTTSSRAAS